MFLLCGGCCNDLPIYPFIHINLTCVFIGTACRPLVFNRRLTRSKIQSIIAAVTLPCHQDVTVFSKSQGFTLSYDVLSKQAWYQMKLHGVQKLSSGNYCCDPEAEIWFPDDNHNVSQFAYFLPVRTFNKRIIWQLLDAYVNI